MGVVISNIISPAGINAGKPIAKTLRLGAALAINPTEALITSSPNTTGKPIAAAPINIVPDQFTAPSASLHLMPPLREEPLQSYIEEPIEE